MVKAITYARYQHLDPRVQERMEILWLKSLNNPHGGKRAVYFVDASSFALASFLGWV